jgi:hypothetical protein
MPGIGLDALARAEVRRSASRPHAGLRSFMVLYITGVAFPHAVRPAEIRIPLAVLIPAR